ncbi:DNA repair protein [Scandinavium lactucae]|uniref:DNA repair protein n=1 Tax=Scandinavium lactucae TaxID=3095028 RepID=A0ABU4QN78_9ENTR|nr:MULTISPECIES: DNA repair protein [unclassified Scandinavium]MDX6040744.1 DNA repair protein [Scandinavium sp. V105_6]MDX6051648.1 DNA repair protein [Scandinavium sp. V105_1]
MNKPIKRLEIIKNAIELEDEEIIHSQLLQLKKEALDEGLNAIVSALEDKHYADAVAAIDVWLQNQRALAPWQDPRIAANKLELKTLEAELQELLDRRSARIQRLDEFNDLYMTRLGPLMTEILRLRKVLAEKIVRRQRREGSQSEPIAEESARQADAASQDYESYRQRHQEAQRHQAAQQRLAESDRQELKKLWRQASKLCHPDLVDDELKAEATTLMVRLNQARQQGDLTTVRTILARLMKGQQPMMASERLNSLERLRERVAEIRQQISALKLELSGLEKEGAWQLVTTLRDQEGYFHQQEKAMSNTIRTLEKQIFDAGFDEVA